MLAISLYCERGRNESTVFRNRYYPERKRYEHGALRWKPSLSSLVDTPFGYTLSMIGGKWRLVIMYWLVERETMRFNELKRKIGRITDKTLSSQLKGMEADGLIVRTEHPQIPPKVEYRLSEKGQSLYPLMEAMCAWGREHNARIL